MIVKTLNSDYEVDLANGRFRRLRGDNPTLLLVPDGEWVHYLEQKTMSFPNGEVMVFMLKENHGGYLRTSLIQEIEYSDEERASVA